MQCDSLDVDAVFRLFTKCPDDPVTLILDVRPYKAFKKRHINQAFCVRLSADGKALVDYSKSTYKIKWSQAVWWGKEVVVYGEAKLKKSHPVLEYLINEARCQKILYYKDGFEEFENCYPFLITPSVKANSIKRYPSQILAGRLYLGHWEHGEDRERLRELNVGSIVTIHNHPDRIKVPSGLHHLQFELPDVEVADISQFFNKTYDTIEETNAKEKAVLVHCGAGMSRSATLCVAYLMRKFLWSAKKAHDHCKERRSLVTINEGFWRTLCALEVELGITSNPKNRARLSENAAGEKVDIKFNKHSDRDRSPVTESSKKRRRRDESDSHHRSRSDVRHRDKRSAHECDSHNSHSKTTGERESRSSGKFGVKIDVLKNGERKGELDIPALKKHQRCMIGRAPGCDVKLEHMSISRQHACLEVSHTGQLTLTDLESGHGTNVDGMWIRARNPKELRVGSVLRFGASTRTYKVSSIGPQST